MDLEDLGFGAVGSRSTDPKLKSGVRFEITALQDERAIYAFSVEGSVKYIGICDSSDTTLRARLSRYQSMVGAGTNKRIAGLIRQRLSDGHVVRILAWKPEAVFRVRELQVDLVKGLENPLIRALRPEWNIHR